MFSSCRFTSVKRVAFRSIKTENHRICLQKRNNSFMQLFHKLRLAHTPDPVESPRLTPAMVTSILRMEEKSLSLNKNVVIKEIHTNQLKANKPIEDRHIEGKISNSDKYLFGVFDGHAGCACAQALKDRLFHYITVAMADPEKLNHLYQGGLSSSTPLFEVLGTSSIDDVSEDLASLHQQSLLYFINDCIDMYSLDNSVHEAIANAFLRLDQDISSEASAPFRGDGLSADVVNIAFSGAVGCVAYIDGLDLYLANVGDSKAVLGSHSTDSDKWLATPLTKTHNAENDSEVKRLFLKHPNESSKIIKDGRLFGELMPLRAFGDVRYKWDKELLKNLAQQASLYSGSAVSSYKNIRVNNFYRTPPYLDAEPEIVHHRLSPKDRFLVLATDGLWDSDGMSVDKVISLIGHHQEGQQVLSIYRPPEEAPLALINNSLRKRKQDLAKRSIDKNVATHLIRHALGLDHGQLSAQLTLPEKLVRYYRDDITITVIYFDQDYMMDFTRKH